MIPNNLFCYKKAIQLAILMVLASFERCRNAPSNSKPSHANQPTGTDLHKALQKALRDKSTQSLQKVKDLIKTLKAEELNEQNPNTNETPLHYTIMHIGISGFKDIAEQLINKSKPEGLIKQAYGNHYTPLHWAVKSNKPDLVKLLVDKIASGGLEPKQWLTASKSRKHHENLLHMVARYKDKEAFGYIWEYLAKADNPISYLMKGNYYGATVFARAYLPKYTLFNDISELSANFDGGYEMFEAVLSQVKSKLKEEDYITIEKEIDNQVPPSDLLRKRHNKKLKEISTNAKNSLKTSSQVANGNL